jgi:hypothetical protein
LKKEGKNLFKPGRPGFTATGAVSQKFYAQLYSKSGNFLPANHMPLVAPRGVFIVWLGQDLFSSQMRGTMSAYQKCPTGPSI